MTLKFIKSFLNDREVLLTTIPYLIEKNSPLLSTQSGKMLLDLLVLGEDHRNRYHIGFDIIAITRAIYRRVTTGLKEGASTIEQQLVRVITADYSMTFSRKLKEILLAVIIRMKFDRQQLAISYLDIAYYGTEYPSLDAILAGFGLSSDADIDLKVCASIIARLKYPEPRVMSESNNYQIERRTSHLLKLYLRKHPIHLKLISAIISTIRQ
ncbi:transglycosylase domain-containing protein [uncultured Muribaculum sp.]|uniref:transglycosylase domain-containing protein n=1 Tax=uncultured Muribaculum sp. TaxID=1918613 RepID=UPI002658EE9A|nr:transglycosylase domain-containing protein [uncultured Muribaculum sp.]